MGAVKMSVFLAVAYAAQKKIMLFDLSSAPVLQLGSRLLALLDAQTVAFGRLVHVRHCHLEPETKLHEINVPSPLAVAGGLFALWNPSGLVWASRACACTNNSACQWKTMCA